MQIFWQKNEKFFQQPKFCPPRPRNCMAIRGYKQSAFCNAFFCPKSCKCQKLFILLHSLSPSALGATDAALRHKSATRPRLLPTTNTALVCVGDPIICETLRWLASGPPGIARRSSISNNFQTLLEPIQSLKR